jgi:hypothetical protein
VRTSPPHRRVGTGQVSLRLAPCSLKDAQRFVAFHHRHLEPPIGHLWSTAAAADDGRVVGVIIVGRPTARMLDDGWTVEVTRCATDGTRNACSLLLAAAWRVAKGRGYRSATTMTMQSESGASLRAAGWRSDDLTSLPHSGWSRPSRQRVEAQNPARRRWWAPGSDRSVCPEIIWPEAAPIPSLFDEAES